MCTPHFFYRLGVNSGEQSSYWRQIGHDFRKITNLKQFELISLKSES
jgi:hypothetical protein